MNYERGGFVGRRFQSAKEKTIRYLTATVLGSSIMIASNKDREVKSTDFIQIPPAHMQLMELSGNSSDLITEGPEAPTEQEMLLDISYQFEKAVKEYEVQIREEKDAVLKPAKIAITETGFVTAQSVSNVSNAQSSETKTITGYYCEYDSGYYGDGGGFCGHMANGENAHNGAAACGPGYPLGTVFDIKGYGKVTCEDRGGGVSDDHIDVFTYNSSGLSSIPSGETEVN